MVDSATRPGTAARTGFAAPSTPAQRTRRARWKDGRLVLGVLLVAVTTLLGARVLASADETVSVWQVRRALPAGTRISAEDLDSTRVASPATRSPGGTCRPTPSSRAWW